MNPEQAEFNQIPEEIKKRWKSWQECENEIETEDFSSIDLYKMETMIEEEDIYPPLKYSYSKRQWVLLAACLEHEISDVL